MFSRKNIAGLALKQTLEQFFWGDQIHSDHHSFAGCYAGDAS
jgi:hypothetical protein